MLVIIDGTGEASESKYKATMKNSFLRKLYENSPIYPKEYFRGPSLLGTECTEIVKKALNWISRNMQSMHNGVKPELYLAGYSRGGTVAIAIAQEIQKLADNPNEQYKYDRGSYFINPENSAQFQSELYSEYARSWFALNRNIKSLALFDAVDRALFLDTDTIPKNVQKAYHARRDPTAGSRRSFSNTGTAHASGSLYYKEKFFYCTHGAMGGAAFTGEGDNIKWTSDHPTEFTPFVKTVIRSMNTFSLIDSTVVIDIVRDEGIGYGPIKGISKPLITPQQDKLGEKLVQDWMWENMKQHGML